MLILGLNAYHGDSSACLLENGQIIAAAEEERFVRTKHWAGFPKNAIEYCLSERGAQVSDLGIVAVNRDPTANWTKKIRYLLRRRPELKLIIDRLKNARSVRSVADDLQRQFPDSSFGGKIERIEHHLAHLASAFYLSPYRDAVCASVDGFGDFASASWGLGRDTQLAVEGQVLFPHSLGIFYQAMTQFIGFPHYGDEYKVMGLAPYGEPSFMKEMRQIVKLEDDGRFTLQLEYFRHTKEKIAYEWDNGSPSVSTLFTAALEELLGPVRKKGDELTQRHRDLARSTQAMYEEAFFHLLDSLHRRYGGDALALAGGCAMNSVANGKVARRGPFRRCYIQSAAGDAGGALGAGLAAWYAIRPGGARSQMSHAFWGPSFSNDQIRAAIDARSSELANESITVESVDDDDELCRRTVDVMVGGGVVGWFQGRMEWGPRALGNRSIVCDPRRSDMKDILNLKIKRRESFRPFAPSILRERVTDWFEEDADVPFMMKVFQIREDKREQLPAVTHADGSGRLQTVVREANPRYYKLIETFESRTGVPIVLNTSFNENEPVVCRPEEALDCFLRTKMDLVVLGSWMVRRRGDGAA